MASLVSAYRAVIHAGATPDPGQLTATAVIAAAILILGWIVFRRLSPAFADEL
jgi:ABC-type polysaccharide/polyol phosphate export permease